MLSLIVSVRFGLQLPVTRLVGKTGFLHQSSEKTYNVSSAALHLLSRLLNKRVVCAVKRKYTWCLCCTSHYISVDRHIAGTTRLKVTKLPSASAAIMLLC